MKYDNSFIGLVLVGLFLTALFLYSQISVFLSSVSVLGETNTHMESNWSTGTEMQTPRSEVAGVLLKENIYIIGGFKLTHEEKDPTKTNTVEIYNTKNNTWIYATPLPQTMDHVAADQYNGKLYVVGGITGAQNNESNKLFIYDPVVDKWEERKSMPTARGALTANFIDGILYAVGGQNSSNFPISTNEAYDPSTDKWTIRTPMPTARHHAASAVVDGELYVIGGRSTERYSSLPFLNLNNNEKYDPKTDTWYQLEPMPSKRSGLGAASINGNIYVFGGQAPLRVYDNNEKYAPKIDEWTLQSPLPTPRHGLAAVPEGTKGNIYVIGGGTNSKDSVSASNEIFRTR